MLDRDRQRLSSHGRLALAVVVILVMAVVIAGIDWGLPSLARRDALFGARPPWTGAELAAYEPLGETTAADVDGTPLPPGDAPVRLNDGNLARAQIIRRYLLFSNQPDEMITFMALRRMTPARFDFDPRLYQYGGLWIYPVGGLLKFASAASWIDVQPDRTLYYDNPAAFGRFYVVARAYAAAWLAVLMVAVAMAVRRLSRNDLAAIGAAVLVALMPAAFAMAHEAKPHLPGAALMLLTCLSAARWTRHERWRDALLAGACCGLAAGMVLTSAVAGIVLPAMLLLGRGPWIRRLGQGAIALLTAGVAYGATNPYVVLHLLQGGDALRDNLANSGAMYRPVLTRATLHDAGRLALYALSLPLAIAGAGAGIAWLVRPRLPSSLAVLLILPAACTALQFLLLAQGKPGEYGRFAIFPAAVVTVFVGWAVAKVPSITARMITIALLTSATGLLATRPYFQAFASDARGDGTRRAVERWLVNESPRGAYVIEVKAEPAPYAVPALDLWRWRLVLTRGQHAPIGDLLIRAIDTVPATPPPAGYRRIIFDGDQPPAPIAWANKPFEILVRE